MEWSKKNPSDKHEPVTLEEAEKLASSFSSRLVRHDRWRGRGSARKCWLAARAGGDEHLSVRLGPNDYAHMELILIRDKYVAFGTHRKSKRMRARVRS